MPTVLFEIRYNAALIILNKPDKRNMLTQEVCGQIVDYVAQAEAAVKGLFSIIRIL